MSLNEKDNNLLYNDAGSPRAACIVYISCYVFNSLVL